MPVSRKRKRAKPQSNAQVLYGFDPLTGKEFELRVGGNTTDTPKGQTHIKTMMKRADAAGVSLCFLVDD